MAHNEKTEAAVEEAENLSSKLIFEVIRREGLDELERPYKSLVRALKEEELPADIQMMSASQCCG